MGASLKCKSTPLPQPACTCYKGATEAVIDNSSRIDTIPQNAIDVGAPYDNLPLAELREYFGSHEPLGTALEQEAMAEIVDGAQAAGFQINTTGRVWFDFLADPLIAHSSTHNNSADLACAVWYKFIWAQYLIATEPHSAQGDLSKRYRTRLTRKLR